MKLTEDSFWGEGAGYSSAGGANYSGWGMRVVAGEDQMGLW